VKSNHYNRQTRRSRLCIKARRRRRRAGVPISRRRIALLTAHGGDLAANAARAAEKLELSAEVRELLSPAHIPDAASVRARQRVWGDLQRLLVGGVHER
jgi:hypothetical protein